MRILGIDEAGRGCVLGPLVIAGVVTDEKGRSELIELGVRDSKLLSQRQRRELASAIREIALCTKVVKLSPAEIDEAVKSQRKLHKLNRLEAQAMARVIHEVKPDIAIVDAADVIADRYGQHIVECLSFQIRIISKHKADMKYPVVSAASIIAKVERDREIDELKTRHGDFGSGYAHDPKTVAFLDFLAETYDEYPYFVRSSWKTAKSARTNARAKQAKLERA